MFSAQYVLGRHELKYIIEVRSGNALIFLYSRNSSKENLSAISLKNWLDFHLSMFIQQTTKPSENVKKN